MEGWRFDRLRDRYELVDKRGNVVGIRDGMDGPPPETVTVYSDESGDHSITVLPGHPGEPSIYMPARRAGKSLTFIDEIAIYERDAVWSSAGTTAPTPRFPEPSKPAREVAELVKERDAEAGVKIVHGVRVLEAKPFTDLPIGTLVMFEFDDPEDETRCTQHFGVIVYGENSDRGLNEMQSLTDCEANWSHENTTRPTTFLVYPLAPGERVLLTQD